ADFDGDQMAVHVPLSVEAQTEARLLMLASNNVLSPATGRPIITPTQDMVLGCYYLTVENPEANTGKGRFFKDFDDVLAAYSQGIVTLHTRVAVRWKGERQEKLTDEDFKTFSSDETEYLKKKIATKDMLLTTAGRIILNGTLPEEFAFFNKIAYRKELEIIIMRAFQTLGSARAAELADSLKNLGFRYATRSGISIAIVDLHVPDDKKRLLRQAENEIELSRQAYLRGEITEVERYSKVIDTWSETTNELTDLIKEKYDRLNSVYMMAFSGARGNISQVRQLVGMRGLMSDPSGRIIDLPIKSNFREGLTVTDYIISSYGARKGLVDTALRTADSGYLTRRLADVAQDVIISEDDCGTDQHYNLMAIKDGDTVVVPLTDRAVGRVLSDHVVHAKTGEIMLEAGTLVLPENVGKIVEAEVDRISIRSPLSCKTYHGLCRKCYGWSLTNNQLVDIGEAVGIIAAQSIGEPGTQLTMRTFHTGGVFTKSSTTTLIKAKNAGVVSIPADLTTREFRTKHGNVISITDRESVIDVVTTSSKGTKKAQHITVPASFELKVKDGETIASGGVIAESHLETGRTTQKSMEKGYKDISSDTAGIVEFESFHPEEKRDRQGNITKTANRAGKIWVLAGDVYTLPSGAKVLVESKQKVESRDVLAETRLVSEHGGVVRLGNDVTTEETGDGRVMVLSGRELNVVTADLRLTGCELIPGKKEPLIKVGDRLFALKVKEGQRIESETILAESVEESLLAPVGGEIRHLDVSVSDRRLVTKPSKLLFIPEERISINKDVSLLNEGFHTGSSVEAGDEVVKDISVKTNGVLQVMIDNNIIREVIVYAGERHEIPKDLELAVTSEQYVKAGASIAPGIFAQEDGVVKILESEDPEALTRTVILRAAQVIPILPEEQGIPTEASSEDIFLRFVTRILVKDGEKVKAGAPLAKTEAVVKIVGTLANLAGRLETSGESPAITILETLSLRRDVPILARRSDQKELFNPTYLLVADGEVIEPGTTLVRTEILAHTRGLIDRGNPLEENRRLLLVTADQEIELPAGKLLAEDGELVHEGQEVVEGAKAPATGKIRTEGDRTFIRIARPYLISQGTQLLTDPGSMVMRGEPLATLVYDRVKTGDIIQGLPRVEELLEARKPKEFALIAEQSGTIKLISEPEEASKIFVVGEHGEEEYQLPPGSRLIVNHGEHIEAGDLLTDGPVNPHDVLRIQGVEAVQRYLVNEVQMVYRSQGVEISDKHIEVIVRQMTRKMKVDDSGESILLPGELVDVLDVHSAVVAVAEAGGIAPVVHPVLLGITKASLNTESFVSAASFQETTRVLTEAAIEGKKDWLRGLKENVVIGRLIPAGTGFFDIYSEEAEEALMIAPSASDIIGG
ncbi:MAG TPA: DNA-directed RNA polymerase subunit beta'', partial [Cyanobacteria bacterium UBA8530]|nr:DNA-directed RNA polymerase subunit beta'' [Cyanobacteria bacterium UBA8530]